MKKKLFLILGALVAAFSLVNSAGAAIVLDNLEFTGNRVNSQDKVLSNFAVSAESTLLIAAYSMEGTPGDPAEFTASYNVGTTNYAMTRFGSDAINGGVDAVMFYLENPAASAGGTVTFTLDSTRGSRTAFGAISLEGTTGAPTVFGTSSGTGSSLSTTGTGTAGNWLVGLSAIDADTTVSSSTATYEAAGPGGSFYGALGYQEVDTSGSTSYDVEFGASDEYGQIVLEVTPIPEPSAHAMLLFSGLLILATRRRRIV